MLEFVAGYRSAFPDARSSVEDQIAEGDKVVTRWRARGDEFEMDGVTIERIEDGRIAEVWVARDELGLLRQLGVVPDAETAADVR
jgi:predicted ester cyclase